MLLTLSFIVAPLFSGEGIWFDFPLSHLYEECMAGSIDSVKNAISFVKNINTPVKDGKTILTLACSFSRQKEVIEILLEHGADVNGSPDSELTPLMNAAWFGRADVVRLLLEYGADVNRITKDGFTALVAAARGGSEEVAWLLLERGADVDPQKGVESTDCALITAALLGHTKIVELLLKHGADVNATTKYGVTALMDAARGGHTKIVELLLKHGADVNATTKDGITALRYAFLRDNQDIVELLLNRTSNLQLNCKVVGITSIDMFNDSNNCYSNDYDENLECNVIKDTTKILSSRALYKKKAKSGFKNCLPINENNDVKKMAEALGIYKNNSNKCFFNNLAKITNNKELSDITICTSNNL